VGIWIFDSSVVSVADMGEWRKGLVVLLFGDISIESGLLGWVSEEKEGFLLGYKILMVVVVDL